MQYTSVEKMIKIAIILFLTQAVSAIVGGKNIEILHRPFQASVNSYSLFRMSSDLRGGGTILDFKYVLTAAHIVRKYTADELFVRTASTQSDESGDVYDVEHIHMHPKYININDTYNRNDVAILQLKTKIKFGDHCHPIGLMDKNTPKYNNTLVQLSGFGSECFECPASKKLEIIEISTTQCNKKEDDYLLCAMDQTSGNKTSNFQFLFSFH